MTLMWHRSSKNNQGSQLASDLTEYRTDNGKIVEVYVNKPFMEGQESLYRLNTKPLSSAASAVTSLLTTVTMANTVFTSDTNAMANAINLHYTSPEAYALAGLAIVALANAVTSIPTYWGLESWFTKHPEKVDTALRYILDVWKDWSQGER